MFSFILFQDTVVTINKNKALNVDYNMLSDEIDGKTLIEDIRLVRKALASPVFNGARGKEILIVFIYIFRD